MKNILEKILISFEPFKSDPKGELTMVISEKTKEKKSSITPKRI